jgi:preprotein translocase subunit SecD
MFHYPRWKIIAILASVLVAAILAMPNILPPTSKQYVADHYGLRPLTLGLDLQGGSNILMEIDHKDLIDKLQQQLSSDIRGTLRDAKVGYSGIAKIENGVTVRITKPEDLAKAKTELEKLLQPLDAGLFSTGSRINLYKLTSVDQQFTYNIDPPGLDAKVAAAIKTILKIMESRVNNSGTTEPIIQQQGKDRIVIQLPGLQNPERLKKLLEGTGKLTFQLVCVLNNQVRLPHCRPLIANLSLSMKMWKRSERRGQTDHHQRKLS